MAFALETLSPALNPAVRKSRRGSCQKQAFRSGGGLTLWLQDKRVWTGGDDHNAFDLFAMDLLMDAGKTMPAMGIERSELVMRMPHCRMKTRRAVHMLEILLSDFAKTFDGEDALLRLRLGFRPRKIWRERNILKQTFDNR